MMYKKSSRNIMSFLLDSVTLQQTHVFLDFSPIAAINFQNQSTFSS